MYTTRFIKPRRSNSMPINTLLNSFFNTDLSGGSQLQRPLVNIIDSDKNITMNVALPGWKKDQITIEVNDHVLEIAGELNETAKTDATSENVLRQEFSLQSFKRSFNLPENINQETISAQYEDGILTIELTKEIPAQPEVRKIDIA